jgi:hypothetical protein
LEIKLEENIDPMSFFSSSEEEVLEAIEKSEGSPRIRDGRICICGHPHTRHSTYGDVVACNPTRMTCDCKVIRLVAEVSDTRPFLRRTEGPGADHALQKSMKVAKDKNIEVKWLIDSICDKCQTKTRVDVVPISQNGKKGFNVFLCLECRSNSLR